MNNFYHGMYSMMNVGDLTLKLELLVKAYHVCISKVVVLLIVLFQHLLCVHIQLCVVSLVLCHFMRLLDFDIFPWSSTKRV